MKINPENTALAVDRDILSELKIPVEDAFEHLFYPNRTPKDEEKYPWLTTLEDPTGVTQKAKAQNRRHRTRPDGGILQPRGEKFCQLVATGKYTPREAGLRAGYSANTSLSNTVALLQSSPEIAARIAELKTIVWRQTSADKEVPILIERLINGEEVHIDRPLLLRQWLSNLKLARHEGNIKEANVCLRRIESLNREVAADHSLDVDFAPDEVALLDEPLEAAPDADKGKRKPAPPSAAEVTEVI